MSKSSEPPPLLGLVTGISYQSGLDYYKGINEQFQTLFSKERLTTEAKVMVPNPEIIAVSIDCERYARHLIAGEFDEVGDYIVKKAVRRLVAAGSDVLVLCSNTAHVAVPSIHAAFPTLPLLHIADTTARAILTLSRQLGQEEEEVVSVGLLGTQMTMEQPYLGNRLRQHGIHVVTPTDPDARRAIFHTIMSELSHGVFTDASRAMFVKEIRLLYHGSTEKNAKDEEAQHANDPTSRRRKIAGVILGCTEIELLIKQEDVPEVPLFNSAALHIEAAARIAAGLASVKDYEPRNSATDLAPSVNALHRNEQLRVCNATDVLQRLTLPKALQSTERALRALSDGSGLMPVRSVMRFPGEPFRALANMPSYLGDYCATKTITVCPSNRSSSIQSEARLPSSSHQGTVQLFDSHNGQLLCVADAHAITLLRTAAASAVATRALLPSTIARFDEERAHHIENEEGPCPNDGRGGGGVILALLGTGEQCLMHYLAMSLVVRDIRTVRVWGPRSTEKAQAAAAHIRQRLVSPRTEVVVSTDVPSAVLDADIVCTLTASPEPFLHGDWLKPGCHVNAIGACTTAHRELHTSVLQRASADVTGGSGGVFVDTLDACLSEPGDIVIPMRQEEIRREGTIVGEIGAVLNGSLRGRVKDEQVTVFKSVGIALSDLTAAQAIYEAM